MTLTILFKGGVLAEFPEPKDGSISYVESGEHLRVSIKDPHAKKQKEVCHEFRLRGIKSYRFN